MRRALTQEPSGVTAASGLLVHPDRRRFLELGEIWPMVPVWAELLSDLSTPVGAFLSLAGDGPGTLLESVERSERWGRYSFVSGTPAATLVVDERGLRAIDQVRDLPEVQAGPETPALDALKRAMVALRAPHHPGLPTLTGGLVGYVAYEAAGLLDGHAVPGDESPCSPMAFHVVDRAVVFDHWRQRLLLVAHVRGDERGYRTAVDALGELADALGNATRIAPRLDGRGVDADDVAQEPEPGWQPNVGVDRFLASVGRTREHIGAGDVFQAVLSRRLSVPWAKADGILAVYRRLRVTNPSPYMFLVRMPGVQLAGSSPEPLVRVEGRRVLTRPIAGTRPRGRDEEEDRRLQAELLADPKERAEHAMLVDLARNDLGKVCVPGTVRPTELFGVERFSRVMHIVSTVEGELEPAETALDALAATFPAGTVTGAPKRRAMEIIAQEEPTSRGPYAGAVGYVTFAGDLDLCITIRTVVLANGVLHVQSGAGVVADSDPEAELRETEAKVSALQAAVRGGREP
jgi:anthranilate synthase component I